MINLSDKARNALVSVQEPDETRSKMEIGYKLGYVEASIDMKRFAILYVKRYLWTVVGFGFILGIILGAFAFSLLQG